jgi:hypothetical protein
LTPKSPPPRAWTCGPAETASNPAAKTAPRHLVAIAPSVIADCAGTLRAAHDNSETVRLRSHGKFESRRPGSVSKQ